MQHSKMNLPTAITLIESSEVLSGPTHLQGTATVWVLNGDSGKIVLTISGDEALAVASLPS